MNEAPPRWEYRVWQACVPPLLPGPLDERIDIYLVREGMTSRLVKLRDGRLDVKELVAQEAGLECWRPWPSRAFPVEGAEIAAALCLDEAARRRLAACYADAGELAADLRRGSAVRPVAVAKRRVRMELGGCPGERVQVLIEGRWCGSEAVEHEDAERVARAVAALGWRNRPNENYGQCLERALPAAQPAMAATSQCSP